MNVAVLLAGGSGRRMGGPEPKQFIEVAGRTLLEHSIRAFDRNSDIDEIVIVCHPDYLSRVSDIVAPYPKVRHVVRGGRERYDSTLAALNVYEGNDADVANVPLDQVNVLIHDCVRCLVSDRIISDCVRALHEYRAVDVAIPCTDTIIEVDDQEHIVRMPQRSHLRNVQTPQAFRLDVLVDAYRRGLADPNFVTTDDCSVVHKYLPDVPICVVPGESTNIKITYPEDLILAEKLLKC